MDEQISKFESTQTIFEFQMRTREHYKKMFKLFIANSHIKKYQICTKKLFDRLKTAFLKPHRKDLMFVFISVIHNRTNSGTKWQILL